MKDYNRFKRGAKMLILEAGLIGLTTLTGCATTGNYAQTQQQSQNQPQQYEEIDYEKMNLLYSKYVSGKPDFFEGKAVFAVFLSPNNSEIFIINRDGSGQNRLTNTKEENESFPFFAIDGKIAYRSMNLKVKTFKTYILDKEGNNKTGITEQVYEALAKERGKDLLKDF